MKLRRSIAVILTAVSASLATHLVDRGRLPARADEPRYYNVPGDVNGDGNMNIADPLFLLNYIFAFGPAPAPCEPCAECPACDACCDPCPGCASCCPQCPACDSCCEPCKATIFAMGQTKCFSVFGSETDCDNPVYPGQDAVYESGVRHSYSDNGDGTVTDKVTGLMWTKEPAAAGRTWERALQDCEGLDLAGYTDWRLPNINELHSLVRYDRGGSTPTIDPIFFFPKDQEWSYWSSSSLLAFPASPRSAWCVDFTTGGVEGRFKDGSFQLRAVRGGL